MTVRADGADAGPAMSDGRLTSRAAQRDSLALAVLPGRHGHACALRAHGTPCVGTIGRMSSRKRRWASLARAWTSAPEPGVPSWAFAGLCVRRVVVTALTA